ncbi:Rhomboid-like protein 11, chloroplastic, variant 2 [Ancistrocladus abbreviatus]
MALSVSHPNCIFRAISQSSGAKRLILCCPRKSQPSILLVPHKPSSRSRLICHLSGSGSSHQNPILVSPLACLVPVCDSCILSCKLESSFQQSFLLVHFWSGKLVEEEEGNFALWLSYILTGAGANLVSWLVLPRNAVSVGASGAVFGLFAISVLVKMSWDWRKILEVLILGQFVIEKVMEAAQASAGLSSSYAGAYSMQTVNHIAHLSGALVGVLLVWLVSRIPSHPSEPEFKKPEGTR